MFFLFKGRRSCVVSEYWTTLTRGSTLGSSQISPCSQGQVGLGSNPGSAGSRLGKIAAPRGDALAPASAIWIFSDFSAGGSNSEF